ncbi:MAG TPA: fumarylacetoacetate hydrolase family protein [Thermoanaerobaculaceae bacterium]|nr:fumarylacetoacetate hydrolase family protein [Thermoanaerobaculaceae bacterium]
MKLATVRDGDGLHVAVLTKRSDGDLWVSVPGAALAVLGDERCPESLAGLLWRDGPKLLTARLVSEATREGTIPRGVGRWRPGEAAFAPPVPHPGSFLDFYAFEQHVRASRARRGLEVPEEWYRHPVYYRSNHRSLIGDGGEAWFPAGESRMDFELEVAAILGAPLAGPTAAEAEAAIAGYCLLNDWSARAIQREVMAVGLGPAKAKDFATSLGPWLVTSDEAGDLASVELSARVNGEEWCRGTLAGMRWGWGTMISFAGEEARFEPGDVFGSGTIGGGCGLEIDRFLAPGDVVELSGGELLGSLSGVVRRREG